jgi:hypothetical protein
VGKIGECCRVCLSLTLEIKHIDITVPAAFALLNFKRIWNTSPKQGCHCISLISTGDGGEGAQRPLYMFYVDRGQRPTI